MIPRTELAHSNQLVGSIDGEQIKVEYYLLCYTHVKSIFEVGQGICVKFPIFIISRMPTLNAQIQQLDPSYTIASSPVEFEEDDTNFKFVCSYKRGDFLLTTKEVTVMTLMELDKVKKDH